jgi:hypothetical protein
MQSSRSFQKALIIANSILSASYIFISFIIKWPEYFDAGGFIVALITLGISLTLLLLDWLDKRFLPIKEMEKADQEANEWKNYLNKIKKELLSDKNSS